MNSLSFGYLKVIWTFGNSLYNWGKLVVNLTGSAESPIFWGYTALEYEDNNTAIIGAPSNKPICNCKVFMPVIESVTEPYYLLY